MGAIRPLGEIAEAIGGKVVGDASRPISGVAGIASASPLDLVFVEEPKHLPAAMRSSAAAVILHERLALNSGGDAGDKPLVFCAQPRLAFARAAACLRPRITGANRVHPSASVHSSAKLASNVALAERVVLSEHVVIGENTQLEANTVVGANVVVGRDCKIYPNVTIYPGVRIGDRVIIHAGAVLGSDGFGYVRDHLSGRYEQFPQIGSLIIENDVEIGANTTIDRGALETTRIGRGTKIDNLVHIGHNVKIGEDVVIAAQTGLSGSAIVEDGVIIAGQVGIADHVRIEAGAILGAQCGVPSKKIIRGPGVIFWGTPARPIREYLKQIATLARLAKKE